MSLRHLDIVLVLLVAVPALALGAPALGYAVGAAAWILQRAASVAADRWLAEMTDYRRRIGYGVGSSMLRVWLLACAIMIVGLTATRADGLTAALVIFGAFSLYFVAAALAHMTQRQAGDGMSLRRKLGLGIGAVYVLGFIVIIGLFGATRQDNAAVQAPGRVQAAHLARPPGSAGPQQGRPLPPHRDDADDRRDDVDLQAHAGAAEPRADRRRVGLHRAARQDRARQHERRDGAQVVPARLHAVRLHLDLQPDRLPAAAGQHGRDVQRLRHGHPVVPDLRRHRQRLDPARPRADRLLRLQHRRPQGEGPVGLHEEHDPAGRHRARS